MEESHVKQIALDLPAANPQISLLGLWATPPRPTIPDPFLREIDYFERVFASIDAAVHNVARQYSESSPRAGHAAQLATGLKAQR
jgi:hypothetical protein